jgi:hypothetical protein
MDDEHRSPDRSQQALGARRRGRLDPSELFVAALRQTRTLRPADRQIRPAQAGRASLRNYGLNHHDVSEPLSGIKCGNQLRTMRSTQAVSTN